MKWLSNTYDPSRPDARQQLPIMFGVPEQRNWKMYLEWLKGKVIGRPKATETYTVEQLEAMNLVGVYDPKQQELQA